MEAINIYPELIKWKPNKEGLVQIAIRFDLNNQRASMEQINYRIRPDQWDAQQKRVKKNYEGFVYLNQILESRLNKHKTYFLKRFAFNLPITKDLIKQYVRCGTLESFYSYAETVIENKKLKDGQGYSDETKRCYRDELKKLIEYRSELPFHSLDLRFLQDYKKYLQLDYKKKDGKRLNKNSIWKAFKFIRMVYNEAVDNEVIIPEDNPFKKFEVGSYETDVNKIKFLELDEVNKIEEVLLCRSSDLEDLAVRVGWRFLAMCVSGLRISDAMDLNDAYFNDAGDIEITPFKTRRHGNKAHVPITSDRQRRYFERTISLPLPPTSAKSFRTAFNIHLKVICAIAGIKQITSHAGRHTMGSLLVDAGVDTKAAMAMLGVKSEKVIKTYLHLKNSKLKSEAEKLGKLL